MKKLIILSTVILTWITVNAQITLETSIPNTSIYNTNNRLDLIKLSSSGYKYLEWNRDSLRLVFYNLNHSVFRTVPVPAQPSLFIVRYITETLFDTDSTDIDFMLIGGISSPNVIYTKIYNEDGTVIFSADSAAVTNWTEGDINHTRESIVTTDQGTKMILDYLNGKTEIYSLPGSMVSDCCCNSNLLPTGNNNYDEMKQSSGVLGNSYPNPATNFARIDYQLPTGVNEGEIVFYNAQGTEMKRFRVTSSFDHLRITTADLPTGVYLYDLQTRQGNTGGKRMVKIE